MKATDLLDRKLSGGEKRSKETHVKKLKKHKGDFEKRYGDDAESVMYAVATKRAKGEGIEENPVGQHGKFVNNQFNAHKLEVAKWLIKQDKHSQLEEIEHLMDKAYPNGSDDRFYKEWEEVVGTNPLPWQSTGVNPPREEGIEDIAKTKTKQHTLPRVDTDKYQERDGLEGPIATRSGKVVYYDPIEGKYYDPDTDMYIDHEDMKALTSPPMREDDFDADKLQGKALMALYKKNEHNNYHSENNLLLAKAFGTPKEVNMVELIIKKNQKQGYTSPEDFEWMHKNINKPYYKELVKGSLGEAFKENDSPGARRDARLKRKNAYLQKTMAKYRQASKMGMDPARVNQRRNTPTLTKEESIFDETWKMETGDGDE
tara:strand:+ start:30 stop:1145 length:1116 start_codon:yes stop_codon:yes gene_type:complete